MAPRPPSDLSQAPSSRLRLRPGSPVWRAAQCNLAALLIRDGRARCVTAHRYAFSLALTHAPPGARYVHYFVAPPTDAAPRRHLVPVTTTHLPGVDDQGGGDLGDDLGGLVRLPS